MEQNLPKWNVDFLKSMSFETDILAENLIQEIVNDNDFGELRHLFTHLNDNNDIAQNPNLHPSVINYFKNEMDLPAWADKNKIEIAQNVYLRFAPQIAIVLNFKALPLCYVCKNGAKVLTATGRLTGGDKDIARTMRRLFETSQMVINVMSPGGFDVEGKGIITVKKVRLYHAAIRYFLLHPKYNPHGWDVETFGKPINQEEMAGTLMAFSALVLDGIEQMGATLTVEEKDAYMHCWNIVGHFIGLSPKLYPDTFNEGWELGIEIIKRNNDESADGKQLTKSLLDFSTNFLNDTLIDKLLMDTLPYYLINYYVKDVSKTIKIDIVKTLGVNKKLNIWDNFKGWIFVFILKKLTKIENKSSIFRYIFTRFSQKFLQGMINQHLKTYNTEFYIPSSLKESWNLR